MPNNKLKLDDHTILMINEISYNSPGNFYDRHKPLFETCAKSSFLNAMKGGMVSRKNHNIIQNICTIMGITLPSKPDKMTAQCAKGIIRGVLGKIHSIITHCKTHRQMSNAVWDLQRYWKCYEKHISYIPEFVECAFRGAKE